MAGYSDAVRLVWCPRVTREERAAFEQQARDSGLKDFAIKTWRPNDPLEISPERDEYFPILYSTVASKRTATFGVDLNSEPARSDAIARARDGDAVASAQNVTIRNAIGGLRNGFFAAIPAYRQGMPHSTIEDRRRNTLGMIIGAFQTQTIFDSILRHAKLPQEVDVYLYPSLSGPGALPVFTARLGRPRSAAGAEAKGGLGGVDVVVCPNKSG